MTRQFIMDTLGIQENDSRAILLNVLNFNDGGGEIDPTQLFEIIDREIDSYFLQPLIDHLLAHPSDDEHNESIVTFLSFIMVLQRNADGTIDRSFLVQNPRNKLATIEQKLFDFLTIKLDSEDLALVRKYVDVVNRLVNCTGIKVPQALLAQLMRKTISHCASDDSRERDLGSSELLIIGVLLHNALSVSPNDNIRYDADVARFRRRLDSLDVNPSYCKSQVLQRLQELQTRSSIAALTARIEADMNRAEQGKEPPSSSRRFKS